MQPNNVRTLYGGRSDSDDRQRATPVPRESGAIEPPEHIAESAELMGIWNELLPEVEHLGVMKTIDRQTFSMLVTELGNYWRASEVVAREGMFIEDRYGDPKAHPAMAAKDKAVMNVARLSSRFGISPLDRQSLSVETPDQDEGMEFFGAVG